MANVNFNLLKKVAIQSYGVNEQINKLYELSSDYINMTYGDIREDFERLEKLVQSILTNGMKNEDEISYMCARYVAIDDKLYDTFYLHEDLETEFEDIITEITKIYIKTTANFVQGEKQIYPIVACLVMNFRRDYNEWIVSNVIENANALTEYHNKLEEGLTVIFSKIEKDFITMEDVKQEIKKVDRKRRLGYIASARELEEMAVAYGYVFKSQRGSHKKFENVLTKKCIEIPIHSKDIGLGLSFAIQKQILEGAEMVA